MHTQTVLITLLLYKLLLLGIGLWAQRRTRSNSDFFLGGRNLGPVVAAISYGASSASAWTLLGMSGAAYVMGPAALWLAAGAVTGCAVAWLWIAPRLMVHSRERNQLTLTEFLAEGASPRRARQITLAASAIILFSFIFYISSQFQGAGNTFATTFALPSAESIALGGLIIVAYTLLGGFWAASLTDTLQGGLMLMAAILLPAVAWHAAGGSEGIRLSLIISDLSLAMQFTAGNFGLSAVGFVVGGLAVGVGAYGQPHLLNRFMALRDARALRQAQVISIVWFALVFGGMFLLGLLGRILLPGVSDPESIFFLLTSELLPPVLGAVLLAAVLSAIMSTADSMLLVAASCVSHDLGLARRFPGHTLWISRLAMLLVALLAIALAIGLPSSIFQRVLFAWVAIGSAFGPILFLRLAGVPLTGEGVLTAILTGFTSAVALYLLPNTPGDIAERVLPFTFAICALFTMRERGVPVSVAGEQMR
ncbi:sodium/proline symporter [Microbulbifer sp. ALW1]|uniref:sodium/proline symporter n=1 Tax=Microbulbifer sp. (strain ALW1) TaxID=1516059 RepID=UPI001359CE5F|nr:sodium/proline symporter [Microbulbifer sp. ALW1]